LFSNNPHSGPQLQLAPGENGSAISGGANSEADRPVVVGLRALLGQLIDCPGFRDSRGTTKYVVHTRLIHFAKIPPLQSRFNSQPSISFNIALTPLHSTPLHFTLNPSISLSTHPLHSQPSISTLTPPFPSQRLHCAPLHSTSLRSTSSTSSTSLHFTPLHSTSFHFIPLHSTPFHSQPVHSTQSRNDAFPLHSTSLTTPALHFAPLHSTSFHFTPFHSQPLHFDCTPSISISTPPSRRQPLHLDVNPSISRSTASLHSTPLRSTSLHSTSLHFTPLHFAPLHSHHMPNTPDIPNTPNPGCFTLGPHAKGGKMGQKGIYEFFRCVYV